MDYSITMEHEDAKNIIVAMGSVTETIEETIDYLNAKGEKLWFS